MTLETGKRGSQWQIVGAYICTSKNTLNSSNKIIENCKTCYVCNVGGQVAFLLVYCMTFDRTRKKYTLPLTRKTFIAGEIHLSCCAQEIIYLYV